MARVSINDREVEVSSPVELEEVIRRIARERAGMKVLGSNFFGLKDWEVRMDPSKSESTILKCSGRVSAPTTK